MNDWRNKYGLLDTELKNLKNKYENDMNDWRNKYS